MAVIRWVPALLLAAALHAQVSLFPLKDLRAGMKGIGKTVFSGNRVEEFQVEILGVLENAGPKQSIILARLSGGPLADTGVLQGMSGSPVYVQGRLVGAVALAFAFAKEPIAGIRPIEEMLEPSTPPPARLARICPVCPGEDLALAALSRPQSFNYGQTRLVEIATPVSVSGFTQSTIEHFSPQLRQLGLEPQQGVSGGAARPMAYGNPSSLQPGSMISVQLMAGDLSLGADGTITHIDGKRVYAFGHRFLAIGDTELPFASADVLTLLPNLSNSFKISASRQWMGAITMDHSAAVSGELGRRAALTPATLQVTSSNRKLSYHFDIVQDRVLTPFLLQMAVFSAIDATERTLGPSAFRLHGEIEFQGGAPPVRLNNMYAGDFNVPLQAALGAAIPLAYVMQTGFDALRVKKVSLELESFPERKQLQIDQAWPSRRTVRPGESVDLTVLLSGDNGQQFTRKVTYPVPVGAPTGPLYFTVADGLTTNLTEFRQVFGSPPKSAGQVVSLLNSLRGNTKAYVRVWRANQNYQAQGEDMPDPPPSAALILAKAQPSTGAATFGANSKVAEMEIQAGEYAISGSRTIQVEVKE